MAQMAPVQASCSVFVTEKISSPNKAILWNHFTSTLGKELEFWFIRLRNNCPCF